mmetsp:Transcript_19340/g.45033  ORF Transcript_19340/g.45033 Transcript_19340/m.45033 type:complete len:206 (+) Transcript_19340:879-1496(+)
MVQQQMVGPSISPFVSSCVCRSRITILAENPRFLACCVSCFSPLLGSSREPESGGGCSKHHGYFVVRTHHMTTRFRGISNARAMREIFLVFQPQTLAALSIRGKGCPSKHISSIGIILIHTHKSCPDDIPNACGFQIFYDCLETRYPSSSTMIEWYVRPEKSAGCVLLNQTAPQPFSLGARAAHASSNGEQTCCTKANHTRDPVA